MKSSPGFVGIVATVVVVAMSSLAVNRTIAKPKTSIAIVVDYSGSTTAMRQQQLAVVTAALESAPSNTEVSLFRMGSTTEEILTGSLDSLSVSSVIKTLKDCTFKSDQTKGTNFARMATVLASTIRRTDAKVVRITVLTDGGDDYEESSSVQALYRESANRIAADRRVVAIDFIGVSPECRGRLRSVWANAGQRLGILTVAQSQDN